MVTLIITGGDIDNDFALSYIINSEYEYLIAVDGGTEFLYKHNIKPTHIIGDFDTVSSSVLTHYSKDTSISIQKYNPCKDATDTQLAIEQAIDFKSHEIIILGGIGSRLDHTLATIHNLCIPAKKGIKAYIINEKNRISVHYNSTKIKKNTNHKTYISLLSLGEKVEGIYLEGFKYPLTNYTLEAYNSIGISNELTEKTGTITFSKGILILIEALD